MQIHSNATTNPKQRAAIQGDSRSCRSVAAQYCVSVATIHRWKQRKETKETRDRSCRPQTIHSAFAPEEEQMILSLRESGLALDSLLETVEVVLPQVRRASLHRLLVRHGRSRLPACAQQATGEIGTFKEYGPGYLHIDCFYLPRLAGVKRYCFVAIDRATRLVYLGVYEHKDKEAATDFLGQCLAFYPFTIAKILTDNGREFTLSGFKNRWGTKTSKEHPFDVLCVQEGIEHRTTKPYTPKTNGMVERANGLIKEGTTKKNRYADAKQMTTDLDLWLSTYNFYRTHSRLGRKTPYEAVCAWYDKQPELFRGKPDSLIPYRDKLKCSQTRET